MRFAIVVSIIGAMGLYGCGTEDRATPQVVLNNPVVPTTPTTTTTTPNTSVSSQEVYTNFVRLSLKSSDGGTVLTIRKWQPAITQVKIFWDSGSDANTLKNLDKIISDLNAVSQSNKFARTTNAAEAHVIINRATADAHAQKYPQYKVTNVNMQGETYTVWGGTGIQKAVIWVSPTTPTGLVQGVIRHELLHGLGFGHTESTKSIMVAVMNSGNYDFNNFSSLDKTLLSIQQDSRVKHGQNEANVASIIKEYAAKNSSARISTEESPTEPIEGSIKCNFIEIKNYSTATTTEK